MATTLEDWLRSSANRPPMATTSGGRRLEDLRTDTKLTDDRSAAPPLVPFLHADVRPYGGEPDSIRSASVLATITTVLLGLGWLLGASWSMIASSARITPGSSDPVTQAGARHRSR